MTMTMTMTMTMAMTMAMTKTKTIRYDDCYYFLIVFIKPVIWRSIEIVF